MSLQYILGSSGSGKSHYLYQNVIEESIKNPDTNYFVIVPEQFTMSTQQKLIQMHPRHGIMNVDILSFPRLAYRIFAEVGVVQREILDDTGKSLVLRKVIENNKDELKYFAGSIGKAGFVEEMKSVISEFLQYSVSVENIGVLCGQLNDNPILKHKLGDIEVLYKGFRDFIQDKYISSEELLSVLCSVIGRSRLIADSVVVLDGFTGFTPVQYRLLEIMLELCSDIKVAVNIDTMEKINVLDGMENLFYLSKTMTAKLNKITDRLHIPVRESVVLDDKVSYRLKNSKPLAFMEKNLFRGNNVVYTGSTEGCLTIYEGSNPKNEIDFVVGEMKRLIMEEGYQFKDMAVVSADIENYGFLAGNIMEQNDIPCFVDYKRNIMGNVIVEYIRSALEIVERDFSYESVFRFLKTGLSDLNEDDISQLENYVLALGIRGYSSWNKKWIRMYATKQEKTVTIEQLDECRIQVLGMLDEFRQDIKKSKTVREYCTSLYLLMKKSVLYEKTVNYAKNFESVADFSMAGEYRQCYAKIVELLDKMVILLGDEEVSFREFNDILDAGFGEIKVGLIPQKKDSVIIGDIERTRLDNVKVLFFLGVNDGNIPKSSERGGILSAVDREVMAENEIVLSPDERENAFIQKFYLYLALTKASDKLYLSYSRTDIDGKSLRVSYLIGVIKKMFCEINVLEEKTAKKLLKTVKIPKAHITWTVPDGDGISRESAALIYGNEVIGSVSRIERFYQCAFSHFVTYGLRLEERVVYDINPADIGTMFHDTLERVSAKIQEGGKGFTEIDENERRMIVEEAVLEATTDYNNSVLFDSERNRYFVKRLRTMTEMTVWAVGEQLKQGYFVPKHFERSFKTDNHVIGRIDRIDTYEDDENIYVKVIDYKTGNSDFNLNDAYYGLKLQLLTYMQAAEQIEKKLHPDKNIVTAGLFYYNIKSPFASDDSSQDAIDREILEELRPKGIVRMDDKVIGIMDKESSFGKSVAIPVSFDKNGAVRSSGNLMTQEQLGMLSQHAGDLIETARQRVADGEINLEPYRKEDKTGCDNCPYSAVCGFDPKLEGYSYKNIRKLDDEEIWEKIGEKNGEHLD